MSLHISEPIIPLHKHSLFWVMQLLSEIIFISCKQRDQIRVHGKYRASQTNTLFCE